MSAIHLRLGTILAALAFLAVTGSQALAEKKYDPGASDTEIKIGTSCPTAVPLPPMV